MEQLLCLFGIPIVLLIFRSIHKGYYKTYISIDLLTICKKFNNFNLSMDQSHATGIIDGELITIKNDEILGTSSFQIILEHNIKLEDTITITRETQLSTATKSIGINDIITGSPKFDNMYKIKANNDFKAVALLTNEARKIIDHTYLNKDKITIVSKKIKYTTNISTFNDLNIFTKNIKQLVFLSKEFNKNSTIKSRLIDNIRNSHDPHITIINLKHLLKNFAYSSEIEKLLHMLLQSKNTNIIIEAAKYLKKHPLANTVLLNILKANNYLTTDQTINIIQLLTKNKFSKAAPFLKTMYKDTPSIDIRVTILQTFTKFGLPSLESFLLEQLVLLKKQPDLLNLELIPCINALGSCGTIKSIQPLHLIEEKIKLKKISNSCNQAIFQIQSRLKYASQGQLSIQNTDTREGQISISRKNMKGTLSSKKK